MPNKRKPTEQPLTKKGFERLLDKAAQPIQPKPKQEESEPAKTET